MNKVCVIGGSRYFGRRVVRQLRDAGAEVTVVNRGSAPALPGVTHLIADRDDEDGLRAALGTRRFDVVIDQVCYTPQQASVACDVFGGRTDRYVMTSTIEVYDPTSSDAIRPTPPGVPVNEDSVDLSAWPVRLDLPWHDPQFRDDHYGEGKRQAETMFLHDPLFPFASVRGGHVLGGGTEDFTGRLDHYVQRIRSGQPVVVHRENHPSSFIRDTEIADVLCWAAGADFVGPVNACAHGEYDVAGLCELIAAAGVGEPVYRTADNDTEASPYSFDCYYGMDNARATHLGFQFSDTMDWLPRIIAEAIA